MPCLWSTIKFGWEGAYGQASLHGAVQQEAVQGAAMRKGCFMWCCVKELLPAHSHITYHPCCALQCCKIASTAVLLGPPELWLQQGRLQRSISEGDHTCILAPLLASKAGLQPLVLRRCGLALLQAGKERPLSGIP